MPPQHSNVVLFRLLRRDVLALGLRRGLAAIAVFASDLLGLLDEVFLLGVQDMRIALGFAAWIVALVGHADGRGMHGTRRLAAAAQLLFVKVVAVDVAGNAGRRTTVGSGKRKSEVGNPVDALHAISVKFSISMAA